jgi:hypothetical protein
LIQVCIGAQESKEAKKQKKVGELANMTRDRVIAMVSSNMD